MELDKFSPSVLETEIGVFVDLQCVNFMFSFECSGTLSDRSKPLIFSMARLDRVKNMTGLVECYGKNTRLRELANLVVVAGYIDVNRSKDREEIAEIEKMHNLIKEYKLEGQFRWIAAQTNRARNGELYRYIADTRGAFVQVCAEPQDVYFPICHCILLVIHSPSFSLRFMKLSGLLLWKP